MLEKFRKNMADSPTHIQWLVDTGEKIECTDGKVAQVWEIQHVADEQVLSEWAKYFRNHYCLDEEIDQIRKSTGRSRKEYLEEIKFPDRSSLGSMVRSGDFGEILVADYLQYVLNYWVPRTRYIRKAVKNESTKGSDILGFKFITEGKESPDDVLAIFESKARLKSKGKGALLQTAVDHSNKDAVRRAESLNATNQKLRDLRRSADVVKVERFQDIVARPYKEVSGAAALFSNNLFDSELEMATSSSHHWNSNELILLIIKGDNMMELVHELYRRAADEAEL